MRDLVGRVAVVTGGASGLGEAMARRFAAAGMRVVVSDIDAASADRVAEELLATGAEAVGVETDVSTADGIGALADRTIETFGKVNVLCNNAGVVRGGRIEDLTEDEWRWVMDVNLWGPIHGVRIFLPLIEREGDGHIVSTSSTSGLGAPPFIGPYAVAKAGVIGLMETLRRELTERNSPIGASVLCPGPVRTALTTRSAAAAQHLTARSDTAEGSYFERTSGAMLQQTGKDPADIADMVVDAIVADRFWIITHEEWGDVIRKRIDLMLSDGSLAERPKAPSE